jgi:aminoglycoside phosphotransferase (APT) family kinase protein
MSAGAPDRLAAAIAAAAAALGLERPEVTALEGGIANRSVRIRDARHDLVLKLAGDGAPGLGARAASELAMQSRAAAAGLAPRVMLADAARGFIVAEHAAGRTPGAADLGDARLLRRLGGWIARLHALDPPPSLPAVDFGARAAGYLGLLARDGGDVRAGALLAALEARRRRLPAPARRAACHHDLHRRNLIDDGERILAVDWEYAGPGDPAADLAACIGYHALDAAAIDALLDGYGPSGGAMRARIDALGWIFDCLWYGWNATAALEGLAVDRAEQAAIAARLGA